jgi:hypothetical protein
VKLVVEEELEVDLCRLSAWSENIVTVRRFCYQVAASED